MQETERVIRKSPFVFLKQLAAIEFFFALLPIFVATITSLQENYEASGLANTVSYSLLTASIFAILQILIIVMLFISWYAPAYHITPRKIVYQRSPFMEDQELLTGTIYDIKLRQGPLARRFDYGTLIIHSTGSAGDQRIKDIPNPRHYRQLLLEIAKKEPEPATRVRTTTDIATIIKEGEGQFIEYKSSLMWDYRRQAVNKDLYEPVMKNLAAFMNSSGGILLIGVDDDGQILGLEADLRSMRKANVDGFENIFSQAFNTMIGVEFRQQIEITFPDIDGRTICAILVSSSPEPAFLTFKGTESFYIRAGNASQPLTISQAARYIQKRFAQ